MIVLNTTFHAEAAVESDFLKWLSDEFLPALAKAGCFRVLSVSHLLLSVEEGLVSYAVRVAAPDMTLDAALEQWQGGEPARLIAAVMARHQNRVLHFTTPMEDWSL